MASSTVDSNGERRRQVGDKEAQAYLEGKNAHFVLRDAVCRERMKRYAEREKEHFREEEERVQRVRQEFDELHPPNLESCPLCKEPFLIYDFDTFECCVVCSGYTCRTCSKTKKFKKCPHCHTQDIKLLTDRETFGYLLQHAQSGVAFQQHNIAIAYRDGNYGLELNLQKSVKWFRKASKQGYRDSQFSLGFMYKSGTSVPQCRVMARELFEKASAGGHSGAQLELGLFYRDGDGGLSVDLNEAIYWLTLASTSDTNKYSGWGRCELGQLYLFKRADEEGGLERAKYWFQKALELEDSHYPKLNIIHLKGMIQQNLSQTLLKLYEKHHENAPGGPVPYPQMLRLLQKAHENGDDKAAANIEKVEIYVMGFCCYCARKNTEVELKRCSRCCAVSYCSRACQVRHHKIHKLGCIAEND